MIASTALLLALSAAAPAARAAEQDSGLVHDAEAALRDVEGAFARWAAAHGKEYLDNASEMEVRRSVFAANAEFVRGHNAASTASALQLNQFADLTFEEFSQAHLGYDVTLLAEAEGAPRNAARLSTFRHASVDAPEAVDWQKDGAVTPVKNQGQCGSCWAFSTTGSIEGINYLETGHLEALSEQELVDCDKTHDAGCGGGLMDFAFEYVVKNGGLDSEADYQYWGAFPSFCNHRKQADRHVVDISGFEDVPANDEAALRKAVAAQPVSVAICVNQALQFYSSGVFDGPSCTGLNHGVLVTGYDTDEEGADGGKYWRVKNSWGPAWGEQGYFRLKRDDDEGNSGPGQCGVAMKASYPVKRDHDNPTVPHICDAQLFSLWECPADTKCRCDFNFFGLFCFAYSCLDQA